MKDIPILFAGDMVRAIIDGRKTMTRRFSERWASAEVGDRLWVRETYVEMCDEKTEGMEDWDYDNMYVVYRADKDDPKTIRAEKAIQYGKDMDISFGRGTAEDEGIIHAWKPSIFMPRRLSRILLEITDLKREPIKDCPIEDAKRESFNIREEFWEYLWERNKKHYPHGVDEMLYVANPNAWAIGFKTLEIKK